MEEDPRFQALKQHMDATRDPEMDKIHHMAADNPEECCMLQVYSFDGVATGWEYLLEPYHSWFKNHGPGFMYEEHRNHLKLLQWQRPGNPLAAESPGSHVGCRRDRASIPGCVPGGVTGSRWVSPRQSAA